MVMVLLSIISSVIMRISGICMIAFVLIFQLNVVSVGFGVSEYMGKIMGSLIELVCTSQLVALSITIVTKSHRNAVSHLVPWSSKEPWAPSPKPTAFKGDPIKQPHTVDGQNPALPTIRNIRIYHNSHSLGSLGSCRICPSTVVPFRGDPIIIITVLHYPQREPIMEPEGILRGA